MVQDFDTELPQYALDYCDEMTVKLQLQLLESNVINSNSGNLMLAENQLSGCERIGTVSFVCDEMLDDMTAKMGAQIMMETSCLVLINIMIMSLINNE